MESTIMGILWSGRSRLNHFDNLKPLNIVLLLKELTG